MPRLTMRMKIAQYLVCVLALSGMVGCNQQSQSQIEPNVKPVVIPAEPTRPVKPTQPVKPDKTVKPVKPVKPAEPVKPVEPVVPVQPEPVVTDLQGGQAEVTVTPPVAEPVLPKKPVKLKPLGKRVCSVPVKGKYVALTFDDGPHASLTPQALDILKRHGAKGTFFMLGQNAARNKSIVARAAAEGHELGVHTWTHIKMNSTARAKVDSEISRTQNVLADASGVVPRVMRPPYGATNKALIDKMYNTYGMATVLWDVDTLDWRKPGVSKVINTAVNQAKPGSIILVHDIHASTLSALEGIVTGLQARGFQLVTVSELLQISKREAAEAAAAEAAAEAAAAISTAETAAEQAAEMPVEEAPAQPVQEQITPQEEAAMHAASEEEPALKLEDFIIQ